MRFRGQLSDQAEVRNGSKPEVTGPKAYFRSAPNNGHHQSSPVGPVVPLTDLWLPLALREFPVTDSLLRASGDQNGALNR